MITAIPVAAAEGCVRLRSSRKLVAAFFLKVRVLRFYDRFAAGRRLRQLLQVSCC